MPFEGVAAEVAKGNQFGLYLQGHQSGSTAAQIGAGMVTFHVRNEESIISPSELSPRTDLLEGMVISKEANSVEIVPCMLHKSATGYS